MIRVSLRLGLCAAALSLSAGAGLAQDSTLVVGSPIPADAEKRFCYYAGRAYSRLAYITVGNASSERRLDNENRLLQCVRDNATGELVWDVRNQVQAVPRLGGISD